MRLKAANAKEIDAEFGALLKYHRKRTFDPQRGGYLTQARLAELAACGISETTVGHWETGERTIKHQDRFILQQLIAVLHEYGGLATLDEANRLLESGLYSQLTAEEVQAVNPDWLVEQSQDESQPLTIIFTAQAIYERFDTLCRWSEADAHARSSWAGMVIWTLSVLGDRVSSLPWFRVLGFLTLWALTSWLAAPILQWPLADPEKRVHAAILFALASIVLPLAIALWSPSDAPADQDKATSRQRQTTFLLQLAGAAVGFNSVAAMLLFLAVGYFYLGGTVPAWVWRIGLLAPLLMAHVAARRIPADRHKMYGGTVRLHPADLPFLITFLLVGAALAAFVTVGYDILSSKATGAGILVAAAGLALWHRHLRWRVG
jgi:hypothetical protein